MFREQLVLALTLVGCEVTGTSGANETAPPDETSDNCSGASPAPYCGERTACECCGSCDVSHELCFAAAWQFELGYGACRSMPVEGELSVTIDGDTFVANAVAAVATEGYVQVNAQLVTPTGEGHFDVKQISMQLPAQLGTFDCTGMSLAAFGYTHSDSVAGYLVDAWNQLRVDPRPACSFTLTAVGGVGERIEGAFAATLVDRKTATTFELTAGTFSVQRILFP